MSSVQIDERIGLRVAVLGAAGRTGRELVREALGRGYEVVAVARSPAKLDLPPNPHLTVVQADVHDRDAMLGALTGADAVLGALATSGGAPDTLTTAAQAAVDAAVPRIVWLGGYGTNGSASHAGRLWRAIVGVLLRSEVADKREAESLVDDAGGAVVHAGPLRDSAGRGASAVRLSEVPHRALPAGIARADVAAAMLDLAVMPDSPGLTVVVAAAKDVSAQAVA